MADDIMTGCLHQEAVMWNPYNGVVQCHRCGVTFVPMTINQQKCQFCGGDTGGIETQDMGEGRVMRLCGTCRGHIAAGLRQAYERTATERILSDPSYRLDC